MPDWYWRLLACFPAVEKAFVPSRVCWSFNNQNQIVHFFYSAPQDPRLAQLTTGFCALIREMGSS